MSIEEFHQQRRTSIVLTATVMAAAIVVFFYWARAVVIPFALAVYIVHILGPVVKGLRRLRLGRIPAVLLTVMLTTILVLSISTLVAWQVALLVRELPTHRDKIHAKLVRLSEWVHSEHDGNWPALIEEVQHFFQSPPSNPGEEAPVPVVVAAQQPAWLNRVENAMGPFAEGLTSALITLVLTAFLLLSKEDMRNRLLRLLGPDSITTTTRALDDAAVRISRFLRAQLLVNTAFGLIIMLALMAIGVPFAALWGFFAGLMRYAPYVGTWIGLIPPMLASLTISDSWWPPATLLVVYISLELITANVVEPRLFGQSLGLSEVAQLMSAVFWTFLWGPVGLVLSGPLTACLLVLGRHVPQLRMLEVLLGDDAPLPPQITFFQRLTARDRDEAWMIAADYVRDHSPLELQDDLFVPALRALRRLWTAANSPKQRGVGSSASSANLPTISPASPPRPLQTKTPSRRFGCSESPVTAKATRRRSRCSRRGSTPPAGKPAAWAPAPWLPTYSRPSTTSIPRSC